ncbi:alpha/beta hydrolase [Leptolyngbya sp. 15MV]|nr:alpha/beta hydrolase [Leptolyngbya sp. 15MV]
MRIEDYPPQEPPSAIGGPYIVETLRRSAAVQGIEDRYGEDVHQGVLAFPAPQPNGSVLVFQYGGGWTNGYKEMMGFLAPGLNAAGVGLVSAGYRLAPRHTFPAAFEDSGDAVAWVWRNAARFGWPRHRIFVGGHSAGGHHAALLAARHDWQARRGLPRDVIRGCLCIGGSFDLTPGNGFAVRPRFLGPPEQENEVPASPCFAVQDAPVPLFLSWGENDFPHLIAQARKMALVQRARGGLVETFEIAGAEHISACYAAGDPGGTWQQRVLAFMEAL